MTIPAASGTPPAEIAVDVALAGRLVAAQHPDLADRPIRFLAAGWDNAIFRLGEDLLLRLPQREVGARLIAHEQRWLPGLKEALPLAIPAPVRTGGPGEGFPWPWSIVPWLEGETADLEPPDDDQGEVLAGFFRALHVPAQAGAPHNPLRGVPLATRAGVFEDRTRRLAGRTDKVTAAIHALWADALAAPDDAAATWIQGDPHPRNVLVRDGRLSAVIDWGDMAAGDRASDLSAVWMLLEKPRTRARAIAALPEVSADTWRRARGWAVLYGLMLLDAGLADDPRMAAIGAWTLDRLREGP